MYCMFSKKEFYLLKSICQTFIYLEICVLLIKISLIQLRLAFKMSGNPWASIVCWQEKYVCAGIHGSRHAAISLLMLFQYFLYSTSSVWCIFYTVWQVFYLDIYRHAVGVCFKYLKIDICIFGKIICCVVVQGINALCCR